MTADDSTLRATLHRLAAAAERLAPPAPPEADPAASPWLRWDGTRLDCVTPDPAIPLDRFLGVDSQKAALARNFRALAAGRPAHDMLLWGARGMGKSALTRTLAAETGLALVETSVPALSAAPALFQRLAPARRPTLLFVDDLAFAPGDGALRMLRSLLDGGIAARPAHIRLIVTSNHRHLLVRNNEPQARHARDQADDELALVDRFGLVLGFHLPDQETYLAMVRAHLAADGVVHDPADAINFALARGGRSGRTAWHYRTELLSRQTEQKQA